MQIFGYSDIGLVRQTNQDCFSVKKCSEDFAYAVVCDGMGGAAGGNIASQRAVDIVKREIDNICESDINGDEIRQLMLKVVSIANEELNKMSNEDINLRGMGTTLVLAVILGSDLRIVNVGDSRAYLINQNGVVQVTKDHSIVQEMVDNGEITKEQAIRHPRKNIITRALGVSNEIDADYFNFEIKQGDVILLCTDGFSNSVTEEDIMELFLKTEFDDIAKRAVNLANETGGSDNITVAAIKR